MKQPDEPKPSEAVAQARAKAERLAGAFLALFGRGTSRTPEQKLVFAHLKICADDDRNSFNFPAGRDGFAVALAAAQMDGAKSILRIINRQIALAQKPPGALKPKPKTIR